VRDVGGLVEDAAGTLLAGFGCTVEIHDADDLIPKFSSEAAERKFWEKNDSSNYLDWMRTWLSEDAAAPMCSSRPERRAQFAPPCASYGAESTGEWGGGKTRPCCQNLCCTLTSVMNKVSYTGSEQGARQDFYLMRSSTYDFKAAKQTVSVTINSDLYAQAKASGSTPRKSPKRRSPTKLPDTRPSAFKGEIQQDLQALDAYEAEHGSFAEMVPRTLPGGRC